MKFTVDISGNIAVIDSSHRDWIGPCLQYAAYIDTVSQGALQNVDHCFGTTVNGNLLVCADGILTEICGPWCGIC